MEADFLSKTSIIFIWNYKMYLEKPITLHLFLRMLRSCTGIVPMKQELDLTNHFSTSYPFI